MEWYRKRVYKLEDDKSWDPVIASPDDPEAQAKFERAYRKSLEWGGDRIPTGIFYDNRTIPPFTKRLNEFVPNYLEVPPAKQRILDAEGYTPPVDPDLTFADKIIAH